MCAVAIPTAGMDRESLGADRFELGSLSGESQDHFGDLSHAGKTSDIRSQLNTDDFKLVEWRSGVLRSREVCLSNTGVEESHVGLVTGCQGRTGSGRLLGMFGLAKGEGRAKQALNMAGRQAKA